VEPPRKLGPAGRRVWRVGRDALEAVAVDAALVAPTLERLARLADVLASPSGAGRTQADR
jgi:hypothetical protein